MVYVRERTEFLGKSKLRHLSFWIWGWLIYMRSEFLWSKGKTQDSTELPSCYTYWEKTDLRKERNRLPKWEGERDRERERDRETETERQRQRDRDRETDRETDRDRETETERQTETDRDIERHRETERQREIFQLHSKTKQQYQHFT